MITKTLTNNAEYAEMLSQEKNMSSSTNEKKKRGQYFTPTSIANLMVEMLLINNNQMRVLDPGSGTGILTAALVDRIINENLKVNLAVDLYENDERLIPYLEDCMKHCKLSLQNTGNVFSYRIFNEDFILHNGFLFEDSLRECVKIINYDAVISNPPYLRITKKHKYAKILHEYTYGQPNVYYMFMAVAKKLIKIGGQVVFLTPRSYCSGSYFKKFRTNFFKEIEPNRFHLFNSKRNAIFDGEKVWQESIILSGFKAKVKTINIINISSSIMPNNKNNININVNKNLVIFNPNSDINLIRLPISKDEIKVLKLFDSWQNNLVKMGMNVSTGPVVTFRKKQHIKEYNSKNSFPLFFVRHIKNLKVIFPLNNEFINEKGILIDGKKEKLLIPSSNYVLLKRVTSKEQRKRIACAAFISREYDFQMIGLENHLNYLYKTKGSLTDEETHGIVAFLNSTMVDRYFRIINGNTQVNATEIKYLPFPEYEFIVDLGKGIMDNKIDYEQVDNLILNAYDYQD